MELSEFLAMLQYEVQKSYDFTERIARGDASPTSSILQIALERVEIDLPVSVTEIDKAFNRSAKEMQPLPSFVKRFKLPYSSEKLATIQKGIPKGEVKGKALNIELVGPIEKIDETRKEENITRIKIVLKPVAK